MTLNNGLLGHNATELRKLAVWNRGNPIIQGLVRYDPTIWRHDAHGNVMRFSDYGNRSAQYGWEIDHYPVPAALGGSEDLSNLRPLHCTANASHGGLLGAAINR